ncbi:MAG: hypothetical protein WBI41_09830 [Azovibrio sp.]
MIEHDLAGILRILGIADAVQLPPAILEADGGHELRPDFGL